MSKDSTSFFLLILFHDGYSHSYKLRSAHQHWLESLATVTHHCRLRSQAIVTYHYREMYDYSHLWLHADICGFCHLVLQIEISGHCHIRLWVEIYRSLSPIITTDISGDCKLNLQTSVTYHYRLVIITVTCCRLTYLAAVIYYLQAEISWLLPPMAIGWLLCFSFFFFVTLYAHFAIQADISGCCHPWLQTGMSTTVTYHCQAVPSVTFHYRLLPLATVPIITGNISSYGHPWAQMSTLTYHCRLTSLASVTYGYRLKFQASLLLLQVETSGYIITD